MTHRVESTPPGRLTCAAVLALVVLAAPTWARADAATDDYNVAVGLHKDKRWDLAADAFRKFLKDHPQHEKAPNAALYLGLPLISAEKYGEARPVLRGFVKSHPANRNLPDAMYRLAECSYLLGEYAESETEFAAFVAQFPKHDLLEWALPYLGDTQYRQKKYEPAVATFQQALKLYPMGRMADEGRFGLARSFDRLKRDAEALAAYKELAGDAKSPRAPEAQLQVGTRLYEAAKYAESAAEFLSLETRFPQSPLVATAQLNAGYAYYQMEKYPEAVGQFEKAAKDPKQKPAADYWQGVSRQGMGEYAAAIALFKGMVDADRAGPYAERAQFQWAECELRSGRYDAARDLYLAVAAGWPKGELAPEALHFAADSAYRAAKPDEAQKLLDRFVAEHPKHRLRPNHDLLQARVLESRGGPAAAKGAVALYESVLREPTAPQRVQSTARLYLARLLQRESKHDAALATLKPLLDGLKANAARGDMADALVLAASSLVATRQWADALQAATLYLEKQPKGDQVDQALSLRAAAFARTGKFPEAQADVDRLQKDFAQSQVVPQTLLDVAEAAYAAKEYVSASGFFGQLAHRDPKSALRAAGLSGLGWSQFETQKYKEAAATFGRLVADHPDDADRVPEASFMQGLSLQKSGDNAGAAAALSAAFQRLAPAEPAPAGSERAGAKNHFAYQSGLEAARAVRRLDKLADADKAYQDVTAKFPAAENRDLVLDEWALMFYESEKYEEADAVFRRLVKEYPKSRRADDARLNLAESDYVARNLDKARAEFAALAESADADAVVKQRSQYNLARIAADQQDWKQVTARGEKFLAAESASTAARSVDSWHVQALLGEARLNAGDAKGARAMLATVFEKKAEGVGKASWFPQVRILIAEASVQLKEYDAAAAAIAEFRKEDPSSPILHRAEEILGRAYKNQAKFDLARAQFERVVNDKHAFRTETAAKSQFLLAETYMIQKDYRNAQREYFKVEQLYQFPVWQSSALYQVAKCDEALNQWKDAVRAYEDLLKKYPESSMAADAKTQLQAARRRVATGM